MNLKLNNIYHGFRLVDEKNIKETNSVARLFYHEKSGARLFHMENDDDNKVFSITFRTPPKNSTGLPHILEHSVLCGSRKFPTKEPFVELVKGSMNTFLNAMTFPDKTMYPVASRNEKDFYNLMDVYLDSVFYPNIYKHKEILMQEGWHYELEDINSKLTYKGVVYNEMKGAFSSPESVLMRKIQETLFPETPYGVESGGDPEVIPELTQEEFLEFHRKYYHPSNSYMFLYGNGDIQKQLQFINDEYLENFDKQKTDSSIPLQKPFSILNEVEIDYPISLKENESDKTYFSLNYVTGLSVEPETYLSMEILEYILLGTPASPLKKALIEAELGKDVFGRYDNSILQPFVSIIVKNSNYEKKDAFKEIVFNTLSSLVKNGLDKKLVEAAVNRKEFEMREADFEGYPKGLIYNIKIMDSWLYDANPMMHLEYEPIFEKIRASMDNRYFEKLIKKYLLDSNHSSLLILKPKKGMAEKKAAEVDAKLEEFKASLSKEELQALIDTTKNLKKWQNTPDSQENLEKIPMLSIEDITVKGEILPQEVKDESGVKVLAHNVYTNGIAYINLLFDTTAVPQEQLPYISLLAGVLGKISTENYSYSDIAKEIDMHTGGVRFNAQVYGEKNDDTKYHPMFSVKGRSLAKKLPELFRIMGEIINKTKFDDIKRLKEIIREIKSRIEMRISNEGHIYACKRLFSYYSAEGYYLETITGLTYYKFIVDIEKDFDNNALKVVENLKKTAELIFNRQKLIVGVTCEEDDYRFFSSNFSIILNNLENRRNDSISYKFKVKTLNEGLMTQGKVQYVAKGFNFIRLGYSYSGILQVFRTIARYNYLWNRIRVQGGAYGALAGFERNGNMFFASYRDPNLKETLEVYDEIYKYIEELNISHREMTKYIIGTVSRIDQPLTPYMKGERAIEYYLRKITKEDIQKEREEILGTDLNKLRELSDMLLELMKRNNYCVLGSEMKIKENENLFDNLIDVFE
jgi:Zn-dependent M16 (insulinase) family peptidase